MSRVHFGRNQKTAFSIPQNPGALSPPNFSPVRRGGKCSQVRSWRWAENTAA